MSTVVVPIPALCAIQTALVGYHYPKDRDVIDRTGLMPHTELLIAISRFKRIPGNLCLVEAEPKQFEGLLSHMRMRGLTKSKSLMDAATAIRASLCVLEEVQA